MVENTTTEYNITDMSTTKKMKAAIAHEYCKKTNVVGKKYSNKKGGWKKEKTQEQFSVHEGPIFPRLSDQQRGN